MAAPAPATASSWSISEDNTPTPQVSGGEVTQNGPRAWDRAWTIQEMRTAAGKWSLAGDAGLLLHLQEFSQRLISRTHELGQEMDGLVHEVKLTSVQVNNVVNNFIMLANTQFVENRVYDEDVSHEQVSQEDNKSEQQEKTREQREAELMPQVTTALRLGMDVIDTAFDRVETAAMESDSEDEDNVYKADPILEAKDPYFNRSLPFLIGSPQFLEDDMVGLVEEESDEELESDQGSISASEDEQESEDSETEYSTSEESGDDRKQKATQKKQRVTEGLDTSVDSDETAYSDEDIFVGKKPRKISDEASADVSNSGDEDSELHENSEKVGPSTGVKDFGSELAARLGVAASKQHTKGKNSDGGEEKEDNWQEEYTEKKHIDTITSEKHKHSKESRKGKKVKEDVGEKTDKGKGRGKQSKVKDEGDDLFGKNDQLDDDDFFGKPGGLFSTGKGLFDDEADADEEGDLFGDGEKAPAKSQRKQMAERDDGSTDETKDEEEEEHEKTLVDKRPRTKSGKLVPAGAVSVFGLGGDFLSSNKSETSDTHTIIKPTAQPAALPVRSAGEGSLFDDNDEDDLFGGVSQKTETVKTAGVSEAARPGTSSTTASKKLDLFADEDEEDDLFGSMAAPATKRKSHSNVGLVVEDDVREESTSENERPKKTVVPEKKLPPGAVSMFGDGPNPFVAALKKQQKAAPDEEDKDEWSDDETISSSLTKPHGSSTSTSTRAAAGARKLDIPDDAHGEGDDEDDDFLTEKSPSNSKSAEKASQNLPGNNSRQNLPQFDGKKTAGDKLFDDADDEQDSDFFTATTQPLGRKQPAAVPASSGVDVSKVIPGSQEKTNTAQAPTQPQDQSKRSLSLFDDDDEGEESAEPLFSNKQSSAPVNKDTARRSSRDLFSNDDLLFAAAEDESPTVDLFSTSGPLRRQSLLEKETPKPSTSVPAKKAVSSSKPNTSNLFGGDDDDDDDDLFSHGGLNKLPSLASPAKSEPDITGSAGDMEPKEEEVKPNTSKPRKPAGAVSMFGGLDPSAILKKKRPPSVSDDEKDKDDTKDEKQAKNEEKGTSAKEETLQEKSPVAKSPKLAVGLFTRDDDDGDKDSDDLFSQKSDVENKAEAAATGEPTDTPDKEEAEAPKPEPTKPKKPAGAVSMFGGLDPSVFLKRRPVEEPEEKDDDDDRDRERPHPPEAAPKTAPKPKLSTTEKQDSTRPKPPGDLFGAADNEDDDDLFVPSKKKIPPPTAPKTPLPTPTEPFKFSEDEQSAAEQAKPRKPAGAVAMFGGINPFAGLKKKSVSVEEDEKEPSPSREETKSPATSPTVLSPDGTHPKTLERGDSVDFDQPAEVDPLASTIKDRPKLNRRRPQSRKARMLAVSHSGISFEDITPTTPTTPTIPEVPDTLRDSPPPDTVSSPINATNEPLDKNENKNSAADKSGNPQIKSVDIFGNDNLLDDPSLSAGRVHVAGDEQSAKGDHLFKRELFAGKNTKSSGEAASDLFSDSSAGGARGSTVKSKTSSLKLTLGKASKAEQQDDLFSPPPGKSKPNDVSVVLDSDDLHSPPPVSTGQKSKASSSSLQDEDDLFASSSVKSSTVTSSKSKLGSDTVQTAKSLSTGKADKSEANAALKTQAAPSSHDDADDIFKDSSLDKRTDTSKKPASRSSAAKNHDSVPNTSTQEPNSSSRPRKQVTREGKLFSDTTDIFSDIPAAAPREAKKKPVKKTSEKKAVLKDDVDDIFADTSAAGIKVKSEPKKAMAKSAAMDSDNIFDDPLS